MTTLLADRSPPISAELAPTLPQQTRALRFGRLHLVLVTLAVLGLVAWHLQALEFMVATWQQVEEYGYGFFVPLISAFLIWQRSDRLRSLQPVTLAAMGPALLLLALSLLLGLVGQLGAIRVFGQLGFVIGLYGVCLAAVGWRGTRLLAMPLALLLLMIPLPQFLFQELSQTLQLLSSQLGVWLIRLFGISVFLEGNVIDLGSYQLQVVEACSGLRYLFPLVVLGCLAAYCFRGKPWQRGLIVAATVPLALLVNGLRIGAIGIAVEARGTPAAQGLLHQFEGGFMFGICLVLLGLLIAGLARTGRHPRALRDALALTWPAAPPGGAAAGTRSPSLPLLVSLVLLATALALQGLALPETSAADRSGAGEVDRARRFGEFPLSLPGGWLGRSEAIAPAVLAALSLDDYLMVSYRLNGAPAAAPWVNVYVAWYGEQSGGGSMHSPRTCIPGDGWAILQMHQTSLTGPEPSAPALQVNRALIQRGDQRQLVYYWFRQRGRNLTGELQVKWYLLQDAVLRGRTDGALVRLVTPVAPQETDEAAERRLAAMARLVHARLGDYIPD